METNSNNSTPRFSANNMASVSNDTQWLYDLLVQVKLEQFYTKIRDEVRVTRPEHLEYLLSSDLENIGMEKLAARHFLDRVKKKKTADPRSRLNKDFQRGDLVWGKIPGWSYWPAMIVSPTDVKKTSTSPNKHWLFWFGEHTISEVPRTNICSFQYYFKQNIKKSVRCRAQFDEAVEEALSVMIQANNIKLGNITSNEWALGGFESNCPLDFQWTKEDLPSFIQVALSADENKEEGDEVKKVLTEVLNDERSLDDICIACCRENDILVQQHPLLEGRVCKNCLKDVNRINKLPAGRSQLYCIVCGQGGEVAYCSRKSCRRAFCEECIRYMDPKFAFAQIPSIPYWPCYVCKPVKRKTCLIKKRAHTKDLLNSKSSPKKSPKVPLDTNKTDCTPVKNDNKKDFVSDAAVSKDEVMDCLPHATLNTTESAPVKYDFVPDTVASSDKAMDCLPNAPLNARDDIEDEEENNDDDDDVMQRTINKILNNKLSLNDICISCRSLNATLVMSHTWLIGKVCKDCKKDVVKAIRSRQNFCIICGQKGNLLNCSKEDCERAYCQQCIKYLDPSSTFYELSCLPTWFCYICNPVKSKCLIMKRIKEEAFNKKDPASSSSDDEPANCAIYKESSVETSRH